MKVMIFGVFDVFHKGHAFFIEEAEKLGDLVIVVAHDGAVKRIKRKVSLWHELKRKEVIQQKYPDATVVLGDDGEGSYEVVKKYKPDMICLGYDQGQLRADLAEKIAADELPPIQLKVLQPHEPEKYKSSKFV